jgi:hypothetical protein
MSRIVSFLLIILFSGWLSSCSLFRHGHGKKNMVAATDTTSHAADTGRIAITPIIPDTTRKTSIINTPGNDALGLAQACWSKRLSYQSFAGKAKIHVETPDENNNFAAHFRIRKDSVIWVNVNLAGIPVARVFVTTDSIFLIDYYHKEAKCLPLSQIAKILPAQVSFSSLQNLVIGEPLSQGTITKAEITGDTLSVAVEDSSYIQHIVYSKSDSMMRAGVVTTHKPGGPVTRSEYNNYEIDNNRKIATGRTLQLQIGSAVYLLEMDFTKIDFDTPLDYPFNIPRSYR